MKYPTCLPICFLFSNPPTLQPRLEISMRVGNLIICSPWNPQNTVWHMVGSQNICWILTYFNIVGCLHDSFTSEVSGFPRVYLGLITTHPLFWDILFYQHFLILIKFFFLLYPWAHCSIFLFSSSETVIVGMWVSFVSMSIILFAIII